MESKILPELDHFTSLTFEEVCQQYFWQLGLSGTLPFVPFNIGNWWNSKEEIDLIMLGEINAILVECKWANRPVGVDIYADLIKKVDLVKPELENRRIQFALCSRSGFTPQLIETAQQKPEIMLFSLAEILA